MALLGLRKEEAAWALSDAALGPDQPEWQGLCQDWLAAVDQGCIDDESQDKAPFESVFGGVVPWALSALKQRAAPFGIDAHGAAVWAGLAEQLTARLAELAQHPLYELFNQERGVAASFLAGHTGRTGQAASRALYLAFVNRQRREKLGQLLATYPVLGRLLSMRISAWLQASCRMLEDIHRLAGMAQEAARLGLPPQSRLMQIHAGLGDVHRGGAAVAALVFETPQGQPVRLAYKPRDMRIDAAYQGVLAWVNREARWPLLACTEVLAVDDRCGFMAWVEQQPCLTAEQLTDFYRSAGALLAVLYILGAEDGHHENLIAQGDRLVLIDAETLLQPDLSSRADDDPSDSGLRSALRSSVLRVGMLPHWRYSAISGRMQAMDVSGLGALPHARPTYTRAGWLAVGTDAMHWGPCETPAPWPSSYPADERRPGLALAHQHALQEGCEAVLRLVLKRRSEWLGPGSPLSAFEGLSRRVVVRPTYIYQGLLQQCCMPSALTSAFQQGLVLEQLCRPYLLEERPPPTWPMLGAEIDQLAQQDVPYFEARVDRCDIAVGTQLIGHWAQKSGLQACRDRINALDDPAIAFQLQLVEGALQASTAQPEEGALTPSGAVKTAHRKAGGELLEWGPEARALEADRLVKDLWSQRFNPSQAPDDDRQPDPTWLALDLGQDHLSFQFGLLGPSPHSGSAGIAVVTGLMAYRAHEWALMRDAQGREGRTDWAAVAHHHAQHAQAAWRATLKACGASDGGSLRRWVRDQSLGSLGIGGMLSACLAWHELATAAPRLLASEPTRLAEERASNARQTDGLGFAWALAEALALDRLRADADWDMALGCAGLIGPLVKLASLLSDDSAAQHLVSLAREAGHVLIRHQRLDGGWLHRRTGTALTGFSHGASGMAAALACLHRTQPDARLAVAVQRAMAFERSLYRPEDGNWPDLRSKEDRPPCLKGWCHGAPGIGLARMVLARSDLGSAAVDEEVAQALQVTHDDVAAVDQLCCGLAGRAAILLTASRQGFGNEHALRGLALLRAAAGRAQMARGRYRMLAGVDEAVFVPGLFTGQAGVALAMLTPEDDLQLAQSLLSLWTLPPSV